MTSDDKKPSLGELLNETKMQVTVTGWKAELEAKEKAFDELAKAAKNLRIKLEMHHDWHLQHKEFVRANGFKYELSSEYRMSDFCANTEEAIAQFDAKYGKASE